jgi:hypothetical protein
MPDTEKIQVAPVQQDMSQGANMGTSIAANFEFEGLMVKQTMKGCFREACGCEDTSEYKISDFDASIADHSGFMKEGVQTKPNHMYALEESSFIQRCCWPGGRAMTINVTAGSEKGGDLIVKYKKPCGMPVCLVIPTENGSIDIPCCCMLPELTALTPQEQALGTSKYPCDAFLLVPKFGYFESNEMVYYVSPETCCGGCCVACKCGKKAVYIPFLLRDPATKVPLGDPESDDCPSIQKLWTGLKKECCSDADNFAIKFPKGITPERKAGLLGMNFLIDAVYFETHNQKK